MTKTTKAAAARPGDAGASTVTPRAWRQPSLLPAGA